MDGMSRHQECRKRQRKEQRARPFAGGTGTGTMKRRFAHPSIIRGFVLALAAIFLATAFGTVLVAAEPAAEATAAADPFEGVWITADGEGYIEIRRQGGSLVGTILGGPKDDDRLDENNPDPALRNRRLTGLQIMDGFERDDSGKWIDGRIYDPNNGKTYGCTLELENESTLKVRGYLGMSLFGRTERWTRKVDRK